MGKFSIVFGDVHGVFYDKKAWAAFLGFVSKHKANIEALYHVGDHLDFYSLSRFPKDPQRRHCVQEELDQGRELLEELRKTFPKKPIYLCEGNHEHRFTRHLWSKDPEMGSLRDLTVPHLLGVQELDIQWVPRDEDLYLGKSGILVAHGDEVQGHAVTFVKKALDRYAVPCILGHHHSPKYGTRTDRRGVIRGWCVGCLCDLGPSWGRGAMNWSHGFAIVHNLGQNYKKYHVELVHIDNGEVVY